MGFNLPNSAGGWGAILFSLKWARRAGGLLPMLRALMGKNSCKSCALGMGGQKGGMRNEKGSFPEVCNKSILAQASDMQGPLPKNFFSKHDVHSLAQWSPRDLELAGRLTEPVICEPGDNNYKSISWEDAFNKIADKLKKSSPGKTFFYASGRSSNEAGFLLQLFARLYGTNNVNNCSYYCHQASGVGLSKSLGTGTATIQLNDLDDADMIFLIGANPASNHPRFMRTLMETRRRGGKVIVINPARERGLENFSVPSDIQSLLFGSEIASTYLQPHIGGDIPLLKGIAKALIRIGEIRPNALNLDFIKNHTEGFEDFREDIEDTHWETIEKASGVSRSDIEKIAEQYSEARNVVFAWAMGITHHAFGVDNVQSIVNLALLRGMVGRRNAGLLPLRGHSNVQGIGSIGFTPQLKQTIFDNLKTKYQLDLPEEKGLDTLSCMEDAMKGNFEFVWNLGGNLYGSNPDSTFAEQALANIDFVLYMNTTLNQGHFRGRGHTTLILPVLARDEEPHATTQESMFNYIRMSDGGHPRYAGPQSEVMVISEIASRVFPDHPLQWKELSQTGNIRKMIGEVVPGFEKMKEIDHTRQEFHISNRILHSPKFHTPGGKAEFKISSIPDLPRESGEPNQFVLMTVRSEGQFNTVVYDLKDRYRGISSRNVVLMNPEDIQALHLVEGERVIVRGEAGEMNGLNVRPYPVKTGNVVMYYPEANVLIPRTFDPQSRTPSFKSALVRVEKETPDNQEKKTDANRYSATV